MRYLTKFLIVIILSNFGSIIMGEQMDAEGVVRQIEYNESIIKDVQCMHRWFVPETNTVYRDCEWGYKNGKEFVSGIHYGKTEDGKVLSYIKVTAFDGKAVRSYNFIPFSGDIRGGIYGYDPHVFSVPTSPKALLGYTLDQDGIYTLSELLSAKYVKNKEVRAEKLGDIECVLLEATGFQASEGKPIYDLRIWIDPKRNYKPLKIEKYESPDDKNSIAGLRNERWKYFKKIVNGIELRQIDGMWFPVCGEQIFYTTIPEFMVEGKTEEDIIKQYPGMNEEEIAKKINLLSVPSIRERVELREIKINKGIDPTKFTIIFPAGCKLWDDIIGLGYVVGGPEGVVSDELKNLNNTELPANTKKEHLLGEPNIVNSQNQKGQDKAAPKKKLSEKIDSKIFSDKTDNSKGLIFGFVAFLLVSLVAFFFMRRIK